MRARQGLRRVGGLIRAWGELSLTMIACGDPLWHMGLRRRMHGCPQPVGLADD
jgi:hypothetical protein